MNTTLVIIALIVFFPLFGVIMNSVLNKAEKETQKGNGSCLGLLLIAILVGILVISFQQCRQCSKEDYDKHYWEPRHTQVIKPSQNNVNKLVFSHQTIAGIDII